MTTRSIPPLAETLAELAANPPTPEQRARFSERFVAHMHVARMRKSTLAHHIRQPHPNGFMANPVENLMTWDEDELENEHDRLHGGAR